MSLFPEARVFLPPEVEGRARELLFCVIKLNGFMREYIQLVGKPVPTAGGPQHKAYVRALERAREGVHSGSLDGEGGAHIDHLQVQLVDAQSSLTEALRPFIDPPRRRFPWLKAGV